MATTVVIQASQAFTRGTTIYPPRNIPAGPTAFQLTVDRSAFTGTIDPSGEPSLGTGDAKVAMAWSMFVSTDSGASWAPVGAAGTNGGVITGGPDPNHSSFTLDLPHPELSTRQLAAVLAVTGPITLALSATLLP